MGRLYFVACPACGFRYPIDEVLVKARVDAHCPACHAQFNPESALGETSNKAEVSS